jgi:AmmeMemoRadiSam system protein A
MEPTSSVESERLNLAKREKQTLLQVASDSIAHGLRHQCRPIVDASDYVELLGRKRATFVTLFRGGKLRGCMGVIDATRSLVEDVSNNAWSAAFSDPRFAPLAQHEMGGLSIHISALTPPLAMRFSDEEDLLRQVRPGVDGLLLEDKACNARGTFLPAVWKTLPDLPNFWRQLKRKAGLTEDYWSDTITISRYTAESID